jgi:prepilin-type processing-associated H-X9-DG protein
MEPISQPPPAAETPTPVIAYATPVDRNSAATVSIAFGALFFIPVIVPGVLAIVYGRRGVANAGERALGRGSLARAGIILGVINLLLSAIALVVVPAAMVRARQQAQMIQCASQLRQLGIGVMMYASSSRGFLPPSLDDLAPFLGGPASPIFTCPVCVGDPAKPPVTTGKLVSSSYVLLQPAARLILIPKAARTVLIYEPLTDHDGRGSNFLFVDGHVEWLTGPSAAQAIAGLKAGQNPPPPFK